MGYVGEFMKQFADDINWEVLVIKINECINNYGNLHRLGRKSIVNSQIYFWSPNLLYDPFPKDFPAKKEVHAGSYVFVG